MTHRSSKLGYLYICRLDKKINAADGFDNRIQKTKITNTKITNKKNKAEKDYKVINEETRYPFDNFYVDYMKHDGYCRCDGHDCECPDAV